MVCDVAYNNVNNWLWTPFIDRNVSNRIYIEIKFTIRDCSLFPGNFHVAAVNITALVAISAFRKARFLAPFTSNWYVSVY